MGRPVADQWRTGSSWSRKTVGLAPSTPATADGRGTATVALRCGGICPAYRVESVPHVEFNQDVVTAEALYEVSGSVNSCFAAARSSVSELNWPKLLPELLSERLQADLGMVEFPLN